MPSHCEYHEISLKWKNLEEYLYSNSKTAEELVYEINKNTYNKYAKCMKDALHRNGVKDTVHGMYMLYKDIISHIVHQTNNNNGIKNIICFGCGTGEEILALATINADIHYYGIDASEVSIKYAENLMNSGVQNDIVSYMSEYINVEKTILERNLKYSAKNKRIRYINGSIDDMKKILEEESIECNKTLVMFIGHTYTCLDQKEYTLLKDKIIGNELIAPKYIYIDFDTEWDESLNAVTGNNTIENISIGSEEYHIKPFKVSRPSRKMLECECINTKLNSGYINYCTITKALPGDVGQRYLLRGIGIYKDDKVYNALPTIQRIESSSTINEIMSDNGYILVYSNQNAMIHGSMKGSMYVHVSRREEIARQAMYMTNTELVCNELFSISSSIFQFIHGTIDFFDGMLISSVFGTDEYLSFAAYHEIKDNTSCIQFDSSPPMAVLDIIKNQNQEKLYSKKVNTYMLVRKYDKDQKDLVDADALYYLLLSSPVGVSIVPPAKEKEEKRNIIDVKYAKNTENTISNDTYTKIRTVFNNNPHKKDMKIHTEHHRWLSIPVYYGSYPIVLLLFKFRDSVCEMTISKAYWEEYSREIRRMVRDIFISQRKQYYMTLYQRIQTSLIEKQYDENSAAEILQAAVENNIDKPWKTWINSLPESEIREEHYSRRENRKILETVKEVIREKDQNDLENISAWLQKMRFFSSNDNDKDRMQLHEYIEGKYQSIKNDETIKKILEMIDREVERNKQIEKNSHDFCTNLHALLIIIGVLEDADIELLNLFMNDVSDVDKKYRLGDNIKLSNIVIEAVKSRVKNKEASEWIVKRLLLLEFDQNQNKYVGESFSDLKKVFCRCNSNVGEKYRYSTARLVKVLEMFTGAEVIPEEPLRELDQQESFTLSSKKEPVCDEDIAWRIANNFVEMEKLIQTVNRKAGIKQIKITDSYSDKKTCDIDSSMYKYKFNVKLKVDIKEYNADIKALNLGQTHQKIKEIINELKGITIYDEEKNITTIHIQFDVTGIMSNTGECRSGEFKF